MWLLQPGRPSAPDQVSALLLAQAREPGGLPWWLAWLGGLGAWLWARWWAPRLLAGPTAPPSEGEDEPHARALSRLLGESWNTLPVKGSGPPGVHEAAAHLSAGDGVALIELCPLGGPAARALLQEARLAVAGRGARVLAMPALHAQEGWREANAETLRAAIADLPRGQAYEVLFCVFGLPGAGPEGALSREVVADLVRRTPLARAHHLAFVPGPGLVGGGPGLQTSLDALRARTPAGVVIVSLNAVDPASLTLVTDALREALPDAQLVVAPSVRTRATLNRALCEALREAAEAEGSGARPARSA